MKNKKLIRTALVLIILAGAFFRFYKLDWGEGAFFHPDENNMAHAVSRLQWPELHPQFFAYGHFPIYIAYFLNQAVSFIKNQVFLDQVPFSQAVYNLRLLSALEATLTLGVFFSLAKKLFSSPLSLLATSLVAFTPGLIQAAHFGTTETLLTLIALTSLYLSFQLLAKKPGFKTFSLLGVVLGLGLATKINALSFFLFPLLALFLRSRFSLRKIWKQKRLFLYLGLAFILAFLISFLTSPYQFLSLEEWRGTLSYEIKVARGLPTFYTRQFINTQPVLFPLLYIFPFSANPILTIVGLIGFFLMTLKLIKKRGRLPLVKEKILLVVVFLILFLPNALLFTKWTRFTTPSLPFLSLFSLELVSSLKKKATRQLLALFLLTTSFLSGLAFASIYTRPDVRLTTSNWLVENLPSGSSILSEAGNVINLPLKGNFKTVPFHFYNLENDADLFEELLVELERNDYLLIPSRRIFANHSQGQFPQTSCYHQLLFSDQLGFKKIARFTSFPGLRLGNWQWEINDEAAEETWSVFDHPVVRVYQKIKFYSLNEYQEMFTNCLRTTSRSS